MEIRDATLEDGPEILAIYDDVIATSTAVYSETPTTLNDRIAWWRTRVEQRYPVLVAADATGVIGFASFGDYWSPFIENQGPAGAYVAVLGSNAREELCLRLRTRLLGSGPDRALVLRARAWAVRGIVPQVAEDDGR